MTKYGSWVTGRNMIRALRNAGFTGDDPAALQSPSPGKVAKASLPGEGQCEGLWAARRDGRAIVP
ncbi:MAG: hypothetical protein ACLPX9_05500 [Rhodomicrobium sp.]